VLLIPSNYGLSCNATYFQHYRLPCDAAATFEHDERSATHTLEAGRAQHHRHLEDEVVQYLEQGLMSHVAQ